MPKESEKCLDLSGRLALRPAEAAQALGIGERTLRKWMRDLDLPYLRVDGVVLIPRAGLEEWIEARLTTGGETDRILDEIMADL
ncbi:MAG: helix-turn-helix domain-containing protein [Planctomycetota bacterium]|jgi:excisionase family DNA binding protein